MQRYEVIEVPNGWRVIENNNNGTRFLARPYKTQADALARVDALRAAAARANAVADVRKRAKFRCECTGECKIHVRRCVYKSDQPLAGIAGVVTLQIVALDHNADNLELDNLRAYCQLCRQRHEADERNTDPLFEIG